MRLTRATGSSPWRRRPARPSLLRAPFGHERPPVQWRRWRRRCRALRGFAVSARTFRRLALANALMLFVIVATGATVRLTGSGLGCPHWPGCTGRRSAAGERLPLLRRVLEPDRLGRRDHRHARDLRDVRSACRSSCGAGCAGSRARRSSGRSLQAPLGAITVHYHLNPWLVARTSCSRSSCSRSASSSRSRPGTCAASRVPARLRRLALRRRAPPACALLVDRHARDRGRPALGQRRRAARLVVPARGLAPRSRDRRLRHLASPCSLGWLARRDAAAICGRRSSCSGCSSRRWPSARSSTGRIGHRSWWLVLVHVTLVGGRLGGDRRVRGHALAAQ